MDVLFRNCGDWWHPVKFFLKNERVAAKRCQEVAKRILQYNHHNIPETREMSQWKPENKCGFLLGSIEFGLESHVTTLLTLLENQEFKDQEMVFIYKMYLFYISPFKGHRDPHGSCHTPQTTSVHSSKQNSFENLDYVPEEAEKKLTHKNLKNAVLKRDGVCLFCWCRIQSEGAHIMNPMDSPFQIDEPSLFQRTGLKQKHQVQNGLLLCANCHVLLDRLKRYIDVVDDKLVIKIVNQTNDPIDEEYKEWLLLTGHLKAIRSFAQNLGTDNRQAVNSDGEMELYFLNADPKLLPNRKALEYHKAACLIWRMAGSAEPDDEYCSDDDGPVDFVPADDNAKCVQKWLEDSNDP